MTMTVMLRGQTKEVKIPAGVTPGTLFKYTVQAEIDKVYASTLPTIPGLTVLQSKPIVWGSVSYTFYSGENAGGQQKMGEVVGTLMQKAQSEILEQAINRGCNAVLGMSYNITNDSDGRVKQVIVTACGTPCIVVKSAEQEVPMAASVIVEPLYSHALPSAPAEAVLYS